MNRTLESLIREVRETGMIAGLPSEHFISGQYRKTNNRYIETYDPGTGKPYAKFLAGGHEDVDEAVAAAKEALEKTWRSVPPAQRGRILGNVAALVRKQLDFLAVVESLDSGKTLSEAMGDMNSVARTFEYYSGACDKLQGDTYPIDNNCIAYTIHEPIGVTAHIVPWNFPLSMLARGVAPALAAGCSVVAKPAEQTPMTALIMARIMKEAGLPDGVFNVVTGTGAEAGAPLVAHPDVAHVTFTGSLATGKAVMKAAAENVTQVTLELGGKSPAIVFADCDLDRAVNGVANSIYKNAGQICTAGSRLVVERSIHAAFVDKLADRANGLAIGHGLRNPDMGAINSREQLSKVQGYLDNARERGIEIRAGGSVTTDPETGLGWFVQPTIFDNLPPNDRLIQEEIFGPVLGVQVFDSEEEAVQLANDTAYGLVAGIFTRDTGRARRLSRKVDAGQVFINQWSAVGIEVPFGGNKHSGIGREKGMDGMRSYCKIKAVGERF